VGDTVWMIVSVTG